MTTVLVNHSLPLYEAGIAACLEDLGHEAICTESPGDWSVRRILITDDVSELCGKHDVILVSQDTSIGSLVKAVQAGASGYLHISATVDQLRQAVDAIVKGVGQITLDDVSRIIEELERVRRHGLSSIGLTDREIEIALMVASGMKNKDIADTIGLAWGTVRNYLSRIYSKAGVDDRTQLANLVNERKGI